jgi:hypothetical protein
MIRIVSREVFFEDDSDCERGGGLGFRGGGFTKFEKRVHVSLLRLAKTFKKATEDAHAVLKALKFS